jgi:hypothetical protein
MHQRARVLQDCLSHVLNLDPRVSSEMFNAEQPAH